MIQLPQGFKVAGREAIDVRLILSKSEMATISDSTMPDFYFAICKDDGKMYTYSKTNEVDSQTGKYRVYAAGEGASTQISLKEGNSISMEEDGIYVEKSSPIEETVIRELFKEDE